MRILHIINSLSYGGAEKLIVDSLPYYKQQNETVDLLVLKKHDDIDQLVIDKSINVYYLDVKSYYTPIIIFKLIPYIKRYDIVHLHLFPTLYWGVLAKLLIFSKRPKLVFTEHSTYNKRRDSRILTISDRIIYKKLDFIGCISEATMTNLKLHLKSEIKNIKVINNGIDLKNFYESKAIEGLKFFEAGSFVVIQISSFREQKDQKTLIRAIKLLPEDIKLILVGDGKLRRENEELAERLEIADRIKFLGIRNDIIELIRSSDVCVLSSNHEGFGLAILEGMASRKASIASDIEGVGEILKGFGLVFEKNNERELANLILQLYKDENFRNKIAEQCYERSKEYDIRKMVSQYTEVYKCIYTE